MEIVIQCIECEGVACGKIYITEFSLGVKSTNISKHCLSEEVNSVRNVVMCGIIIEFIHTGYVLCVRSY